MAHDEKRRFGTTSWSLVIAAGDRANPRAREALESLCRLYWPPIYTYLRRRGYDLGDAEDLTQGFFLKLLEKGSIAGARADRGKFRTFLLTALKNYLADEHARQGALKRGGGRSVVSFDAREAEAWLAREPVDDESPDRLFDRRWAGAVIERAISRLEKHMVDTVGPERLEALRPFLSDGGDGGYAGAADVLGIGETAVRVAVHRMRRRLGELLREEIAQTVASPAEVDEELRELQRIVRG
jgi:RNA polymerase sigma factor (sigma-70 family)